MAYDWISQGTPITEHPLFSDLHDKSVEFLQTLESCEAELGENATILRRQIYFILEAIIHFRECLKKHSLNDLK
jgi:hypothetical protein